MLLEKELKFDAVPSDVLPDLNAVVKGATIGPSVAEQLSATYWDTADLALARWGVTLRFRVGDGESDWTLKLPTANDGGGTIVRREFRFPGVHEAVPADAREALLAYTRRKDLQRVAYLDTRRTTRSVLLDGAAVAVLCDDDVHGKTDGGTADVRQTDFREIEVELVDSGRTQVLKAIRHRLRQAGFRSEGDPLAKVFRILGDAALGRPDVVKRKRKRKTDVGDAISACLAASVVQLIESHAGTRLGGDIEDLHEFRVATRRLRSDLRTFHRLLDADWTALLRAELRWLGDEVGAVRDLDVLHVGLADAVEDMLEDDRSTGTRLVALVELERATARDRLMTALSSTRYLTLLDMLVEAAAAPKLAVPPETVEEQTGQVIAELVRKPWKRLRRAANGLTRESTDEDLHAVRILAKHCRYGAEAAIPFDGHRAEPFAKAMKELQEVLGNYNDSVVMESWLRQHAGADPSLGFVAGALCARQTQRRQELRKTMPKLIRKINKPKLTEWMK